MDNNLNINQINNQSTSDTSFLDSSGTSFNIKDVLAFLLHNLHWFVICAAIGGSIAFYQGRKQEDVFQSDAKLIIRFNNNTNRNGAGGESAIMNGVAQSVYSSPFVTSINNEIMIITSKSNMIQVVERLNLNVRYTTTSRLVKRTKDLYGTSPYDVEFVDARDNDWITLSVSAVDDDIVRITAGEAEPVEGNFGEIIYTPVGGIIVNKTWFFTPSYYDYPISVVHQSVESTADYYRHAIQIGRDDNLNTIINLSLRDNSPERAADVLNETISVYNDDAIRDKQQIIANTYDYINERLSMLDRDLDSKEQELAAFKRRNQIIDVSALGQSSMAQRAQHSEEAAQLERLLSTARYIKSFLASGDGNAPIVVEVGDANVASVIAQYNDIVMSINRYEASGASNNPVVIGLNSEKATVKGNLTLLVDGLINSTEERLNSTQKAVSRASAAVEQVPVQQIYVSDIERLQEVKSSLYLNLLSKREELLISQPSIEGAAKVIDEARVNRTPVAPNKKKMMLIGILLGLLFPAIAAILRKVLDTKVRYRSDIEKVCKIPFVGEIPQKSKHDGRNIVVVDKKRDHISEAFRMLRSNVAFMTGIEDSNVFMTASLYESSGKTFVSMNLAACFAIAGSKVVVVDLDLRKCTLTKNVEKNTNHIGVSNYLAGSVTDIKDIVREDVIAPGVDFVSSGKLPPNPAELLMSSRLGELFRELRKSYQYIFVDCVPLGVVADSEIVRHYIDTTLFVVRSGKVDKRDLTTLVNVYESGKYPNMGLILNGIQIKKHRRFGYGYGYGYGYGSGSGYGYGYGHGYGYGYGYGSKGSSYGYGGYGIDDNDDDDE